VGSGDAVLSNAAPPGDDVGDGAGLGSGVAPAHAAIPQLVAANTIARRKNGATRVRPASRHAGRSLSRNGQHGSPRRTWRKQSEQTKKGLGAVMSSRDATAKSVEPIAEFGTATHDDATERCADRNDFMRGCAHRSPGPRAE